MTDESTEGERAKMSEPDSGGKEVWRRWEGPLLGLRRLLGGPGGASEERFFGKGLSGGGEAMVGVDSKRFARWLGGVV